MSETPTKVCIPCKGGDHSECDLFFTGMLAAEQQCCCEGEFTLDDLELLQRGTEAAAPTPQEPALREPVNPGYVHPDAFKFSQSIGTFTDPASTGRKLAARLFKIKPGMVCEWAGMKNVGGGLHPIVGCMRNPASDIHHGPDKNTLNNAKVTWELGDTENIHLICSFCHNRWHGLNDPTYEKTYDRVADQARPWLPLGDEWQLHEPVEATRAELLAEDERREALAQQKGGRAGGRGAKGFGAPEQIEDVAEGDDQ